MPALIDLPLYGPSPPLYTGTSGLSSLVPDTFHVAIDGRPYMIDLNQPFYRQYHRQLAQLIRTQADTSTEPGDQTMDPNSLWRRSFEDWTLGAGQRYLDRPAVTGSSSSTGSVPNAFWQSKGIDALTNKWQISLLPDTTQVYASTHNVQLVTASGYVYLIDGATLKYSLDLVTWKTVTGTPAHTASSICTDGFNVYVAYGTGGVYQTVAGTLSASQLVTSTIGNAAILGYCNGRLMLADGAAIYNIISYTAAALPPPLFTAGNPGTTFTNFAEGIGAIYVGAVAGGDRSWIYGMTVTSDGTALGAPVVQGQLPDGEQITSLLGYLSFLIVGSTAGVRMCTTSSSGGVTLGALIPTSKHVDSLAGWGRWVWFGWTVFDGVSSGLGKMDLENQVISGVLPAYCSDLMVTTSADVNSIVIWNGTPVFAVSGVGVYTGSSTQLVQSGYIDSGYVMYDLTDNKIACLLDVQALGPPEHGTTIAAVSKDMGPFNPIGTQMAGNESGLSTYGVGPVTGQRFEVRLTLERDTTTPTEGPVITRWTLRSYPAPARAKTWQLPLLLNESITNKSGSSDGFDPLVELAALEAMATSGRMVNYQEGNQSYPVFVQDVEFLPDYTTESGSYFNGIALVNLVGLPAQV